MYGECVCLSDGCTFLKVDVLDGSWVFLLSQSDSPSVVCVCQWYIFAVNDEPRSLFVL